MSPVRLALSLLLLCGNQQATALEVSRPQPFLFGAAAAPSAQAACRVDCMDAVDAGRARKVQLVFRTRRVDLAWMLFPAGQKAAFLEAFAARHGRPALQVDLGVVLLAAGPAAHRLPAELPSPSP